jgi:hypothetical protein
LELIKGANLALRFLWELFALGTLGYWGFKTGSGTIAKIGLGAPLVAAVAWGTFVSPQAPVQLPGLLVLVLQVLIFGSVAAGFGGHRPPKPGPGVRGNRPHQRPPDVRVEALASESLTRERTSRRYAADQGFASTTRISSVWLTIKDT